MKLVALENTVTYTRTSFLHATSIPVYNTIQHTTTYLALARPLAPWLAPAPEFVLA
jgi:hypothetical protein